MIRYFPWRIGEWKKVRAGSSSEPVTHCYVKDRQNNLLGFTSIGEGIRNIRDLTCKRNSGVLRGKPPLFEGDVDVFVKKGEVIYKTGIKLVPWESEKKRGEEEEKEKKGGEGEEGEENTGKGEE